LDKCYGQSAKRKGQRKAKGKNQNHIETRWFA
jgi:hypothetical protein